MTFTFSEAATASRFEPLTDNTAQQPLSPTSNLRLLWGHDPYLLSRLLSSIAGEAVNRRLPLSAVYDPLLPERLVALSVEGLGHFTLAPQALPFACELIDCTLSQSEDASAALVQADALARRRAKLSGEIASLGQVLADTDRLLSAVAERIVDRAALRRRAERSARKIPRGNHAVREIAAISRDADGVLGRFPFPADTKIVGLPGIYSLSALFLADLSAALSDRGCCRVLLTSAITGETVGIWLPESALCYLADAPDELRDRQLTLCRFTLPHTPEERRAWRGLASAAVALEQHLDRRLCEYRKLAKEEEALRSSLCPASRLQSFRKRLLIDLFCS